MWRLGIWPYIYTYVTARRLILQPCMRPKPGKPGKPGHPHRTVHISLPGSSTASMPQDPLILLHGLLVLDLPSCSRQKKTFLQSSLNCQKMSGCLFVPDVVCLFASDDADRGYTLLYLEDTTERRSPNSSPLICVPGLIYLLYFLFSVLYLPIVCHCNVPMPSCTSSISTLL